MKIAVTGGGGFIGHAVLHVADQMGHEAFSFDLSQGNSVTGDLGALRGAQAVIHLAGMLGTSELFDDPMTAIDVNIKGTVNVLNWCEDNEASYVGITMPDSNWANVYQATKLCAMRLATAWHRNFNVPVSHVRAFNVYGESQKYGEGHPQKFMPTFATLAWQNKPIPIWGDGEQTMDMVDVFEVARMLVDATRFGNDEVFDGGTGIATSVNDMAAFVIDQTGSTAGVEHYPMRIGEEPNTTIVAEGEGWNLLGWQPTFNLDRMADVVNWYKPKE